MNVVQKLLRRRKPEKRPCHAPQGGGVSLGRKIPYVARWFLVRVENDVRVASEELSVVVRRPVGHLRGLSKHGQTKGVPEGGGPSRTRALTLNLTMRQT